jgi:hypothetical protein
MVVAMMTRTDEALTFLRALRPQGPWVLTSIFPDAETTTTETFDANDEAAVRQFIESHNDTKNIYYSVNPLRTKKASKAKKVDTPPSNIFSPISTRAMARRRSRRRLVTLRLLRRSNPSPRRSLIAATAFSCCSGWPSRSSWQNR